MKSREKMSLLFLAAAVLTACGNTSSAASTTTSSPTSSTTSAPSTTISILQTTTTTTSAPSTIQGTSAIPRCHYSQLSISEGSSGAGLGHSAVVILFKNSSSSTCYLYGYPGAAGLNSSGQQVTQAKRTLGGYLGGLPLNQTTLPTVTLTPGETASAMVEGTDNPIGNATTCPVLHGLLVTAPNTKTSVKLAHAPGDCSYLQVHPVVPGTTGSLDT